ncbi:hypothetical protein MPTK1_4g05300 [Marchantia polymorpha subsp. ruderalis]|uniref:DUF7699 domain-containing protein n=2 Tax=Marchantia polymorpha TaxID=3197 RepID=A0AAF6B6L1_MARPO|nr:hypothetical protein MARPO_0087s0059 [Marchantia polymorpha]BBN07645.1 hypothetical protein Mp_4g05300 [Marchantia polymorpha subsp. ruderalis]|eukprot:PTQ33626.1 hypothetical protein MARPO_0087s0059 [Marchantia polymorpha]
MAGFKDLKKTRNILPSIPRADRRAAWHEPEFEYDGREPPKAWLARMRRLQQIHGYSDKETMRVANECLKGDARLWFRIHQPQSFDSLRTGLHTRFASGPIDLSPQPPPQPPAVEIRSPATRANESPSASSDQCSSRFGKSTKRFAIKLGLGESSTISFSTSSGAACLKAEEEKSVSASGETSRNSGSVVFKKSFSMSPPPFQSSEKEEVVVAPAPSREIAERRESSGHEPPKSTIRSTETFSLSSMSNSLSSKEVLSSGGLKSLNFVLPIHGQQAIVQFKHAIHCAMKGDWRHMSPDFCRFYLQCYGMRTSGSKSEQIHRIRDHLELTDGSGARKYPRNSFIIDCTDDLCVGDVILFEQRLREGYDLLNGKVNDNIKRITVGRVVKHSKSPASEQVFTIEVYWSRGPRAFRPMRAVCIRAVDLMKLKPSRQRWLNEESRNQMLEEKRKSKLEKQVQDSKVKRNNKIFGHKVKSMCGENSCSEV